MGFKIFRVDTYDGKANPMQWLTLYEITVRATGKSEDVIANYLPIMLNQSVNSWPSAYEMTPSDLGMTSRRSSLRNTWPPVSI